MKVLKGVFGLLSFLIVTLSIGLLANNPASLNITDSISKALGIHNNLAIFSVAIPIIIISFLVSAYFGAVMSVNVKKGDKTRHAAEFGMRNIAYHPEILTTAGLKARTEMAHWSIILVIALVGMALGYLHEVI